jgi:hypothetical protein
MKVWLVLKESDPGCPPSLEAVCATVERAQVACEAAVQQHLASYGSYRVPPEHERLIRADYSIEAMDVLE